MTLKALTNYLRVSSDFEKADRAGKQLIEIFHDYRDKEEQFNALSNYAACITRMGNGTRGQEMLLDAYNLAIDSKHRIAIYNLIMGEIKEVLNQPVKALQFYFEAGLQAKEIDDDSLLNESYKHIYIFYSKIGKTNKALEYNLKAKELLDHSKTANPYEKLWTKLERAQIYNSSNQLDIGYPLSKEVIDEANQLQFDYAKEGLLSMLRTSLIDNHRMDLLTDLFSRQYPNELNKLQIDNEAVYFKVKSLIFEYQNNQDSALYCMRMAKSILEESGNAISKANYYKRIGEYFIRQNNPDSSIAYYSKSLELSLQTNYLAFIIPCTAMLDSLYFASGNLSKAYYYAKLNKAYSNSKDSLMENDKLVSVEIDHIEKVNALNEEKQAFRNQQIYNLQLFITVLLIAFALIILVLVSNTKLPKWVIKFYGFLTFVFLFEFIIYIADTYIHKKVHGNFPWLMVLKIVLVAFILPLHHWTEEKIVHFLLEHKFLRNIHFSIRTLLKKLKPDNKASIVKGDDE